MSSTPINRIRQQRLASDQRRLAALADTAEPLRLMHQQGSPPHSYLLALDCPVLTKDGAAEPVAARGALVQVTLPPSYPSGDGPIVLVHQPATIWHPNIASRATNTSLPDGLVCTGGFAADQFLDALIWRIYHILLYHNFSVAEDNCLNPAAAQWARQRQDKGVFPLDDRPLVSGARESEVDDG